MYLVGFFTFTLTLLFPSAYSCDSISVSKYCIPISVIVSPDGLWTFISIIASLLFFSIMLLEITSGKSSFFISGNFIYSCAGITSGIFNVGKYPFFTVSSISNFPSPFNTWFWKLVSYNASFDVLVS